MAQSSPTVVNGTFVVSDAIRRSALAASAKSVALAYWESLSKYFGEPSADLLYYAHYVHPIPLANELVGDLYRSLDKPEKAHLYYEREMHVSNSESTRKKEVSLLVALHDFDSLRRLATDPQFRDFFPREAAMELAAHDHRWADLVRPIFQLELELVAPAPLILTLVAGFVWMAVALQAFQPPRLICFRTVVPWLAVMSGMASTLPTLFADSWESEIYGLRQTGEFLDDLLYFVAGVGVREELIKLIFFLPFVPILLMRKSRLEMLMIAGFVGLGFAINENLLYFYQAGPMVAFGRVLTANFLHLAATAAIGLALCNALRAPLKNGFRFVGTLLLVMLTHGCYDAFMAVLELRALHLVSMVAFLLLSLYFFRQLGTLRDGSTDQFSISATLILGLAALEGTIFVCAASMIGMQTAALLIGASLIPMAMIVYMFYWQLGEGIAEAALGDAPAYSPYAV